MDNITLIWAILGGVGTGVLGMLFWGFQEHIQATRQNTIAIAVLTEAFQNMRDDFKYIKEQISVATQ